MFYKMVQKVVGRRFKGEKEKDTKYKTELLFIVQINWLAFLSIHHKPELFWTFLELRSIIMPKIIHLVVTKPMKLL